MVDKKQETGCTWAVRALETEHLQADRLLETRVLSVESNLSSMTDHVLGRLTDLLKVDLN